jgi:flavin-dependent thymidylate synthase
MSGSEVSTWVDRAMYSAEDMPLGSGDGNGPVVRLLSATPDPLGAMAAMGAMYEGRVVRDLRDITDDDRRRYWEQVCSTHLRAPLEAIDFMFQIEGVTRAFTHQLVRQRTAVYAQESLRFAVKERIAARPGPLVASDARAMKVWNRAVGAAWNGYRELIANGVPAEEARGLLPHDTLTRVVYKTNLRNLADHAGNRLCTQAQFEWRLVFAGIVKAVREYRGPRYPWEPSDVSGVGVGWQWELIASSDLFRPVCYSVGHCPFAAEWDRGCTIRERVNAGRWDEIEHKEWLADPTAAWLR